MDIKISNKPVCVGHSISAIEVDGVDISDRVKAFQVIGEPGSVIVRLEVVPDELEVVGQDPEITKQILDTIGAIALTAVIL